MAIGKNTTMQLLKTIMRKPQFHVTAAAEHFFLKSCLSIKRDVKEPKQVAPQVQEAWEAVGVVPVLDPLLLVLLLK